MITMRILSRRNLSNKARSKHSEKRALQFLGGKLQPASGALPSTFLKGDVKSDLFLVDDKTTHAKQFNLKVALWDKLHKEAWVNNRYPLIRVEFTDGPVLYVLDERTLSELVLNKSA
jgi:hypothetical protein